MVLLTGCEHISENSSNTIPSSEQPRATNFSVAKSENNQVERAPSLAVQDFKKLADSWGSDTDVLSDNFFNSTEDTTSTPDVKLGEATDFDNFFSNANQDQSSDTKFNTTAKPSVVTETLAEPTLKGEWGDSIDFDNFFSNINQEQSSDTKFNTTAKPPMATETLVQSIPRVLSYYEKQEKIKFIKEESERLKKENLIAEQVRNEDIDSQLEVDLSDLIAKLPVDEKNLAQKMQDDLRRKIRLLDADTAIKITNIRILSLGKSATALASVEKKILGAKSNVEDSIIEHIFATEADRNYRIREEEEALHIQYISDIEQIKLQSKNNPRLVFLEKDVKAFEAANQKIINIRITELESQRVAEALIIEAQVKAKHQLIIDALRSKSESSLKEYSDTVENELEFAEKVVLDQLESKNIKAILSRVTQRRVDNKRYIREIKNKIQKEQLAYEKKVRDSDQPGRDARVIAITNNLKNSIKYIEASRVQALGSLKALHKQLHQSKRRGLKTSFTTKEQMLIKKSKQKELKVLSLFNTENNAILSIENKAIEAINTEIDARVKAKIKAMLDSFEALKKEEAENKLKDQAAKKSIEMEKLKKSKESPGFFESLF